MRICIPASISKTQYYINQAYADYVKEAGYQPILVVPGNDIREFVKMSNGLLLPGGIDLDPIYYGEDNYSSYSVDPDKDAFERELLYAFLDAEKPILGICRGFQLIAREYMLHDNELEQFMWFTSHINDHAQTTGQQLSRNIFSHFVDYRSDVLYSIDSEELQAMAVNSMHHQGLMVNFKQEKVVSIRGFDMAAWTKRGIKHDKKYPHTTLCEALRIRGWGAPVLAVQWHPEELKDYELLNNFFGKPKGRVKGAS